MKRKYIKLLGKLFFILGIFLVINAEAGITGAVIGTANSTSLLSLILGLIFLIGGMGIMAGSEEGGLEEIVDVESFRNKIKQIENREISYEEAEKGYESRAIVEATILEKVPLLEAIKIYDDANRKVESGEWVEVYKEKPRYAKNEKYSKEMATSLIQYFGPKEYQGKISKKKANTLMSKGILGKLHSVFVPSKTEYNNISLDEIPKGEHRMYKKVNGRLVRKIAGKDKDFEGEMPNSNEDPLGTYPGGRPLHRHWEIKQMYDTQE